MNTPQNTARLKALIHYICQQCERIEQASSGEHQFGMTKLNKILYFSDSEYYRRRRIGISGAKYIKMDYGPVVDDHKLLLKELENDGAVAVRDFTYPNGRRRRSVAVLKDASPDMFNGAEISVVDEMIDLVMKMTAVQASDLSHNRAWESASMGEEIPLFTAHLAQPSNITEADMAWAVRSIYETHPHLRPC